MKQIKRTNKFSQNFKQMIKRGKDPLKLEKAIEYLLFETRPLPAKYKDHKLKGDYEGSRELHIEPDWLLIYYETEEEIILEAMGTHSDLFNL